MECEGFVDRRLLVKLFSSSVITNPAIVTIRAVVFRYQGMVITFIVVGGMLYEMVNLAIMLSSARLLIGLINSGLFSLMMIWEGNRGLDIRTK